MHITQPAWAQLRKGIQVVKSEEFRIGVSVVSCSKTSCLALLQAEEPKAKAAVPSADSEGRKSITSCRHAPGTLAPLARSGSLIAGIIFRH